MRKQRQFISTCIRLVLTGLMAYSLTGFMLSFVCFAAAQAPTPAPADDIFDREKSMTREERIKAHQQRIDKIITEMKKRQTDEAKKSQEAQQPQGVPAPIPPPPPGQPLPTGPIMPAQPPFAAAQAPTPAPAAAPSAARSESRSLLHFRPYDSIVNSGETFFTEVVADTKDGNADKVSFLIQYPNKSLNPLAIDFSPIMDKADKEIEYSNNPETGELFARILLKAPVKLSSVAVAKIIWEALEPTESVPVRFVTDSKLPTGIYLKGNNVLGSSANARDGIIQTLVVVRQPRAKYNVQKVGANGLIITSSKDKPASATMVLRLESAKTTVNTGQEFPVSLYLDNANQAPFDRLRVFIQFDPSCFEVVDVDRGNAIHQGVNISDGFARKKFAFDFLKKNLVDNKRGIIEYDNACELNPLRVQGELGRITFRAKQPVERTDVVLVVNDPGYTPTTDVSHLGTSMLTDRPKQAAALDGVALTIVPSRPAENGLAAQRTTRAAATAAKTARPIEIW
ncbi:MAG: cohesin domain-containing protein [bacterium]